MIASVGRRGSWLAIAAAALASGCGGGGRAVGNAPPPPGETDFARDWVLIDRVASGNPIAAVTRGPDGFVAITHLPVIDGKIVSRNNLVATSADGVNWAERAMEPDAHYWSIDHGNGRYVAVGGQAPGGGQGVIAVSEDGKQFREVARAATVLRRVRHTERGFIAVGMDGTGMVSADGESWRQSVVGPGCSGTSASAPASIWPWGKCSLPPATGCPGRR